MTALEDIPVTKLKGVGSRLQEVLAKLDIYNLQDLLFHLPARYEDRTFVRPLASFRPTVQGVFEVEVQGNRVLFGRRRSLEVIVRDDSGEVTLRFYHFSAAQARQLSRGTRIRGYGEARLGRNGIEFYHPEYQILQGDEALQVPDTLTPIYALTEGIQQPRLRALCQQTLDFLRGREVADLLPEALLAELQLPSLKQALQYLHAPPREADQEALLNGRHPCQRRLIIEELLAHHIGLLRLRQRVQQHTAWSCPSQASALQHQLAANLPFELTGAQQRVLAEIVQDLAQPFPMLRLVQGDVGSGKTVVAAMAALQALETGGQVALMAPTEILAEQHYLSFEAWLQPLGIELAWLSGKSKGKQRDATLARLANGEAQVIIGTHALFQDDVQFSQLVLAIIDEQHRFGVHQRLSLKNKGEADGKVPHQLIMTATPIPRTLAMSAYADLDTSIIDERPPGRQAIETFAIPDTRRNEMVERVQIACEQGRQVYWVCTLIEESEALQCQAAEDSAAWLQEALQGLQVGLVHGRMKAKEKTLVMEAFKAGKLDVLVATTVIEVGVDVPNATLIVIENPERLGLAQLHQLRGRVGRGSEQSYCALMYHPPLSQNGKERLRVMRESDDGFVIAEKDLEIRGPGEVLGTRQTGLVNMRIADLQRDQALLPQIKIWAQSLLHDNACCDRLLARWIGHRDQYAEV